MHTGRNPDTDYIRLDSWVPMHRDLKHGPFVPHNLIPVQGRAVALLNFPMAPGIKRLMSSVSKKQKPSYACLSEATALHSQRVWAEVSSSSPHLLHKGLLDSPIK